MYVCMYLNDHKCTNVHELTQLGIMPYTHTHISYAQTHNKTRDTTYIIQTDSFRAKQPFSQKKSSSLDEDSLKVLRYVACFFCFVQSWQYIRITHACISHLFSTKTSKHVCDVPSDLSKSMLF